MALVAWRTRKREVLTPPPGTQPGVGGKRQTACSQFLDQDRCLFRGRISTQGKSEKVSTLARGVVTRTDEVISVKIRVPFYSRIAPFSILLLCSSYSVFAVDENIWLRAGVFVLGVAVTTSASRGMARSERRGVDGLLSDLNSLIGPGAG